MFCPECGKPNPDENRFCQYCSALLVDNSAEQFQQPVAQPVSDNGQQAKPDVVVSIPKVDTAKVKGFIQKQKKLLVPIVAVVIALIVFVAIGSSLSSPEKVVESYFTALTENDYEAMYKQLALPESDLLTKEAFTNYMTQNFGEGENPYYGVKKFDVKEIDERDYYGYGYDYNENRDNKKKDENPVKNYQIIMVDKTTGESSTYFVTLIEQDTKTLLFFKNYKVSSASFVAQNVKLYVDGEAAVTFDDIALTSPETDEYGTKSYSLPAVFKGEHKVTLTSDLYEPFETDFYIYENYDSQTVRTSYMKFKEDILTSLETKALDTIKTMYANALANKPFSIDMMKTTPEYIDLSNIYTNLVDNIAMQEDGTGLNEITFTSGAIRTNYLNEKQYSVHTDDAGRTTVSFTLNLTYDFKYTRNVGWYEPQLEVREGSNNDSVSFQYTYVDGEWNLSSMGNCVVYYY